MAVIMETDQEEEHVNHLGSGAIIENDQGKHGNAQVGKMARV